MDRERALNLLHEYTASENLRKHGYAVEAAMRAYARKYGEDEEAWGITGLLHDFDYERWPTPQDHPYRGSEILRGQGCPEEIVRAILSHADYTGVERRTRMEKALHACDDLTGFIVAVALVRPTKSIHDVRLKSVKKKMKDKTFCKQISREELTDAAGELGEPSDEHVQTVLQAMQGIADRLGLEGEKEDG